MPTKMWSAATPMQEAESGLARIISPRIQRQKGEMSADDASPKVANRVRYGSGSDMPKDGSSRDFGILAEASHSMPFVIPTASVESGGCAQVDAGRW
jgi:hypothetical protein